MHTIQDMIMLDMLHTVKTTQRMQDTITTTQDMQDTIMITLVKAMHTTMLVSLIKTEALQICL